MKRILVMLSIKCYACGNDKYVDKIDKAVKTRSKARTNG